MIELQVKIIAVPFLQNQNPQIQNPPNLWNIVLQIGNVVGMPLVLPNITEEYLEVLEALVKSTGQKRLEGAVLTLSTQLTIKE
jgi:hypothetical protein